MNECNSERPSKVRMYLNFGKRLNEPRSKISLCLWPRKKLAEVVQPTPNERDPHFFIEQDMDFLVPLMKNIAKALQPLPQEHLHERVAERIFNDLVPHFKKEVVEVLQDLFQERVQDSVVEVVSRIQRCEEDSGISHEQPL